MNKLLITQIVNRFKRANNANSAAGVVARQVEGYIATINYGNYESEKVSKSWISNKDDLTDCNNGLEVVVKIGKYHQCNYVMIDLDRVNCNTSLHRLVDELVHMANESNNVNKFYIGYTGSVEADATPDSKFSYMKEFIKYNKNLATEETV